MSDQARSDVWERFLASIDRQREEFNRKIEKMSDEIVEISVLRNEINHLANQFAAFASLGGTIGALTIAVAEIKVRHESAVNDLRGKLDVYEKNSVTAHDIAWKWVGLILTGMGLLVVGAGFFYTVYRDLSHK